VSRVIVIGGADQGRQVIDAIVARGFHTAVGVLDRALARGDEVSGIPVLGADDQLAARASAVGADHFVVAIGDNATRGRILERERARSPGLEPATIVHPSAVLGSGSTLGPGSIILAGAVVGNGCHFGPGVLLGIRSSVDHDGVVADHASLGPGATTGGNVRIGRATAVGLGASVIHGITIGDDTVIGAGAVVVEDVPDRVVAYGVPCRVARSREPGEPYLA
jgi:sugar O-acyltransferase (sialic acid O-acetyltransferase NeuD family)